VTSGVDAVDGSVLKNNRALVAGIVNVKRLGIHLASEIGCSVRRAVSMAQKVQVLLVDDLDGSEATETVAFGLDGAS
jgi:hypothetical protein